MTLSSFFVFKQEDEMFNKTKKIIIIVIAVLVLLETLVLGSLIVYRVTQNSYEHYIETAEEYE